MADTRVTITGVDNGVSNLMQRLRQNAKQTAQQMIQDARTQSKSAKDQLELINQQIRAIEKKGKLSQAAQQQELKSQYAGGGVSKQEFQQQSQSLQGESREQKIQLDLLRELIETTKMVARQEIVADEKGVEKEIDASKAYRKSEKGVEERDIMEVFKQDIQEEMLPEEQEKGGSRNWINQIGPLLQQRNEVYALASLSKMIPVIGGTLNSLYQKALGQAEQTESARGRVQAIAGQAVGFTGGGAANYGKTMSQFMSEFLEPTMRAMSGTKTTNYMTERAMEVLEVEKGTGVSRSIIQERMKMNRGGTYEGGGEWATSMVKSMAGPLMRVGLMGRGKDANWAQVSEYMQIQNQLTATQIQKFDEANQNVNANALAQFGSLGGNFANPQVLGNIVRTVNDALATPATPYAQAMQFTALSQINPNASRFELMEMQEKGIQQPQLMKKLFDMVSSASGGNTDLMMEQIKALMPQLSFANTRKMVEGYQSGDLDLDFSDKWMHSGYEKEIKKRASQATGLMERRSAGLDNVFAVEGEKIAAELAKFGAGMDLIKGTIETILGTSSAVLKQITTIVGWVSSGGMGGDRPPKEGRTNKIEKPK